MTTKIYERLALGLLFALFILAIPALFSLRDGAIFGGENADTTAPNRQAADFAPLGEYTGSVDLEAVYSGVHSDVDPRLETLDLGEISLVLSLSRNGNEVTGYVLLDRTLVFPQVTEVAASTLVNYVGEEATMVAVGPRVDGTFDGANMHLVSSEFNVPLSAGQTLDDGRVIPAKVVKRQFEINATADSPEALTLTGQYRETMWDYSPTPTTLVGEFTLTRPDFTEIDNTPVTPTPPGQGPTPVPPTDLDNHVFLPLVETD